MTSDTLENENLLVILRLMPGELISELVKALSPRRGSRLAKLAKDAALVSGGIEDLLVEIDLNIRRLAAHKAALIFQEPPSYRQAVLLVCERGGVALAPDDTVGEMERKLLIRTLEPHDKAAKSGSGPAGPFSNLGRQAFNEILRRIRENPAIRQLLTKLPKGKAGGMVAAAVVSLAFLAIAGRYLAGQRYRRLEDCIRVIAIFRQAKFFENIAAEAA